MRFICKFWITGYTWFYTNGVYFMVLIGYLRHRSVVTPFKEKLSCKRLAIRIILVYLTTTLLLAPRFVSLEKNDDTCADTYSGIFLYDLYSHSLTFLEFVLPITLLVILYVKICFSLYKHSKTIRTCSDGTRSDLTKSRLAFALQRRNSKALFTSISIVVIFGVANLTVQINLQILTADGMYDGHSKRNLWTSALVYIASAGLNPYIYALLDDAISARLKKKLKVFSCCCHSKRNVIAR